MPVYKCTLRVTLRNREDSIPVLADSLEDAYTEAESKMGRILGESSADRFVRFRLVDCVCVDCDDEEY